MPVLKSYVVPAAIGALFLVRASAAELAAGEKSALQSAPQGGVVMLDELWSRQRELPAVPVKISATGDAQLLLSDKPEYFYTGNGIALREKVRRGVVRLYIYHVPQPTNGPKIISAVLENTGSHPLEFRFLRRAFPTPGHDYYLIGKTGLRDFFDSEPEAATRRVPPGGRIVIDPNMDQARVTTSQLVHGFYEFEITQPARITTFERDPGQSSVAIIDELPRLPADLPGHNASGAGRGLFLTNEFNVVNQAGFVLDTARGAMRLIPTGGRRDPAVRGHDSIEQSDEVRDSGNYGMLYHLRLKQSSSDGRSLALFITKTAQGGQWCGAQSGAVQVSGGAWRGGTVAIPSDRVAYGKPGEMVLLQKFPPLRKGATRVIELLYSPPGASCMPTPLIFVPY